MPQNRTPPTDEAGGARKLGGFEQTNTALGPDLQHALRIRDIVHRVMLDAISPMSDRDQAVACRWFAQEGLLGYAFERGPVAAAELAYGLADVLAVQP